MSEHEVQSDQPRLDVLQFVLLAGPQILPLDGLVHLPSEKVIDTPAGAVRVKARMFPVQELANKCMGHRSRFGLREAFELAVREVTRVRSHNEKKLALALRVAEKVKSFELERCHGHTDKTSRITPVSRNARRMRLVSPVLA